jgi:hypothetical protein
MKKTKMKPAFVDQILFWFFLIALTIGIVGTISDNEDSRVKYQDLKSITDRAALAAGKYYGLNYNSEPDSSTGKSEAESTATNIVQTDMDLIAQAVTINYTWDFTALPYTVTATIPDHTHSNFWWRFFGLDEYQMDNINSTASISFTDVMSANNVAPVAINDCEAPQILAGDSFTLTYDTHDNYSDLENDDFFVLSSKDADPNFECPDPSQNSITQPKQIIDKISKGQYDAETTFDLDSDYKPVSNVCFGTGAYENDIKQLSQVFKDFPLTMSFIILGCGSTANNLSYEKLITVSVTGETYVNKVSYSIDFTVTSTGTPVVQLQN